MSRLKNVDSSEMAQKFNKYAEAVIEDQEVFLVKGANNKHIVLLSLDEFIVLKLFRYLFKRRYTESKGERFNEGFDIFSDYE